MKEITKDMTAGRPGKLIFDFALSLMLGNVFQQLYTFADTVIVGRYLGVNALAALGATERLVYMMFGCIQGITQGFSIGISQKFGSRDYGDMRNRIACSFYLGAVAAVLLTLTGVSLCLPVLRLLNTPENILYPAKAYLRILYLGVPVSMLYNLLAAVLRAVGDGRTPLKAVTIASLVNIGLDILFVVVFKTGIGGAAYATVLAQMLSALYCLFVMAKVDIIRLRREDFCRKAGEAGTLLKLGMPMGFQNIITGLGGVMVQRVINGFGVVFLVGFTAARKLYGLLETAAVSYGYAAAVYTGQNMGAGLIDRIRKGLREASVLGCVTAYGMSFIMVVFGKVILESFVTGGESVVNEAVQVGCRFLLILAVFFPLLYFLYIIRSCVQGMGNTFWPVVSSMVQLAMRLACAVWLTRIIGESGVFWGEIFAWIGAILLLAVVYRKMMKKKT
ncbi:MAG: MATE family efflux transporter [Lachnospiraceae bacterium]|nr:MATE family efflux transporter [Lachnospiraceae bacterium]